MEKTDRRQDDSFFLSVYRRRHFTGLDEVATKFKPCLVVHFYIVPDLPSERMALLGLNRTVGECSKVAP